MLRLSPGNIRKMHVELLAMMEKEDTGCTGIKKKNGHFMQADI